MARHGETLAGLHKLHQKKRSSERLLNRLADNENILTGAYALLTEAVKTDFQITPAGEWLLDNFYLIEEHIQTAKRHFPKSYSRGLPYLANGPSAGLPRVYDIALEIISHGDGRVDSEGLSRFVVAYQSITKLKLGELWAIPIMLRLALIENLRRVGVRIVTGRTERNLAIYWVKQMIAIAEMDPKNLVLVIADMAATKPPMAGAFVAEFARRLQGQNTALRSPLTWIEQSLSESGLTIEQVVKSEGRQQATEQISISNSITSLRLLDAMDWREFVESMSTVEATLRQDIDGIYGKMDFATRDRYRRVVEQLAKGSQLSETEVAEEAIQLAHEPVAAQDDDRRASHVGFYLIDQGLCLLEQKLGTRVPADEMLRRLCRRCSLHFYAGSLTLLTLIFSAALLLVANREGVHGWSQIPLSVLFILCSSYLTVALVNWLVTLLVIPNLLPRMDFSKGIPQGCRTLIVVPSILTSPGDIENLAEALEIRYLGNRDDNLSFALLTDFKDALEATTPEDDLLLQRIQNCIEELNNKYPGPLKDTFFLFHRPRSWNQGEGLWMGYERKRGKIAQLNSFLRGGSSEPFSLIVGNTTALSDVKYVITLDADTQLPRDSARQFVGAMAHPLNRPFYDDVHQRICRGYGVVQPRVAINLPSINRSRYAQLFAGEPGIDPYTRAVSDVYQDLFNEGSYVGKGIYDVDAFEQSLHNRFPENLILSHDLLEGSYCRAGLLSDVLLYEDYPAGYLADVSRRRRWIRGDWQIASWILPWVPGLEVRHQKNPLSVLSRFKILDNLRRSLLPSALTLLLILGWTVLATAWFWTLTVVGIVIIPALLVSVVDIIRKPDNAFLLPHLATSLRSAGRRLAQALLMLACLPFEAYFSLDAIARSVTRMFFTHTRLLEWNPSGISKHHAASDLVSYCRLMAIGPALVITVSIYLAFSNPVALTVVWPIVGLWFISPVIAWWISQPLLRTKAALTADQVIFLHKLSRKTWSFFEHFVGPEDNWLPPDNYQEYPAPVIAHRTSPTNMGLALLANLAAYDFGYIACGQLLERTANAFASMQALERYKGHFYNWYDTLTLQPLAPFYISTVDSGNLAGHLLTLRQGLLALSNDKILNPEFFAGLANTLGVLTDVAGTESITGLDAFRQELDLVRDTPPETLMAARLCLDQLASLSPKIIAGLTLDPEDQVTWWVQALTRQCEDARDEFSLLCPTSTDESHQEGIIPSLNELALQENPHAVERIAIIQELAIQAGRLADMEYDFLYDKARHLLTIGYNLTEHRRDSSYYDLLASEARLCSFVLIAQDKLPQEHWFALGRLLTISGGTPILTSWSGSMFEYLMPLLVMPTYENTLLDQAYRIAVERQIEYGTLRDVPWGISESGYNLLSAHLNYQYRAFGVPSLGLKRRLAEDLVIAPYAAALALMVAPDQACRNLHRMAADGIEGRYGFYEAVDYTPVRVPHGQSKAIIRSFMAHHQGMSFLSLAYLLLDRPMQKYFESDPTFKATNLLLQEQVPKATRFYAHTPELADLHVPASKSQAIIRIFNSPNTPIPEIHLLSNGSYQVMTTNAGGGYSKWKDISITRWREDSTRDDWGTFCYLKDVASGEVWSTAYQPMLKRPDKYEAIFSEARAEFRCTNNDIEAHTEVTVSPEDDIELRRISLTNRSRTRRQIEITSYAEVVLATASTDSAHPAFSNLFVETEILHARQAIICSRRPRHADENPPWMFHLVIADKRATEVISYETDRMQFIGRGNSVDDPLAMRSQAPLSGNQGSVLDPIVAIRYRVALEPDETVTLNVVTGIAESRAKCLGLVEKYQDWYLANRVFDLAYTHSQVILRQLNATEADAQLYGRLASSIIYANDSLRAHPSVLIRNHRGQSGLWGYAISGDLPIVLLRIGDPANIDLVRQMVQAHAYWRLKGLAVDLVIWNEDHAGYRQLLQDQIMGLISTSTEANVIDHSGGIFVKIAELISEEDRVLLQTVARVIISDNAGPLAAQVNRSSVAEPKVPLLTPTARIPSVEPESAVALPGRDLIFPNGLGGFTADGREYVITILPGQTTPAPWVNVLANPSFGTLISESGVANTWSENSHEFRLTPWSNDPVSDPAGEAFYIRDEDSGHFWSPTLLPCRGATPYVARHGFGYSVFEHTEDGIHSELRIYVAMDAAVKFAVFKLTNQSGRARRMSLTGYLEWVLADLRPNSMMHIITEVDATSGALFAHNPYSSEFANRVAFFDVDDTVHTVSGNRTRFLGRNGTLSNPAAMKRVRLSGKVGPALDPCGAIQVPFDLVDGQEREIIFRLGVGRDINAARQLVQRVRGSEAAHDAFKGVQQYWQHTLGTVQVDTPDPAVNILANGWLLYQVISCRLWGRTAFYQPSGAYGFRDQLQDVLALIHTQPSLLRAQIVLCASRQFQEGDVQHWWQTPAGRGIRSHCSDDYLWLPFAASRYVLTTGDTGVLDESIPFIQGRRLNPGEDSYYDLPRQSEKSASLYEHCQRAVIWGLRFGKHGLPLMGTGDWNDGMNMVGEKGKGESIWLGFFLHHVLEQFKEVARLRGDLPFVERCEKEAVAMRQQLEMHGWDGEWYRRAYFDDGTPLGSISSPECQIDSIAQSWAVLSGAGDNQRVRTAMDALDKRLVNRKDILVQLLATPFDKSDLQPGYIKGYPPGVRENGGQYTHAAVWSAMAFAALGDNQRAWELLTMLNPLNHSSSPESIALYKVEPYVMASDVYAQSPHTGHGGWTWYTGSAGWMYQLIVESLLGLRLQVDKLHIEPHLPKDWSSFKLHYRYRETPYHITILQSHDVDNPVRTVCDGIEQNDNAIPLMDDRREHTVEVRIYHETN
jgi:cellobiose phosphorylase